MQLRRFKGRALPEVVRQVRDELGPEAVILHTKPTRPRGLLRFFRGAGVEVVAAIDDPAGPALTATRTRADSAPRGDAVTPRGDTVAELRDEVAELRDLLIRFGGAQALPPALLPLYRRLLAGGLDERLAYRVLVPLGREAGEAPSAEALLETLEARLAAMVPVSGASLGPGPGVLVLVGPSGAGKTTTVAKLAVHAHLAGRKTEILSLDAESLGAGAHLEALSAIVGVPSHLAASRDEIAQAFGPGPGRGLTLVDTPGLAPRDVAGLAALAELLAAAHPTEVHLVVSATMKVADARAAVRAFAPLGVTHLLPTHLDETATAGSLLAVALEAAVPVSYLGTGREVPGDLHPATAGDLPRRALRGERES